jgi:hypothetical protein
MFRTTTAQKKIKKSFDMQQVESKSPYFIHWNNDLNVVAIYTKPQPGKQYQKVPYVDSPNALVLEADLFSSSDTRFTEMLLPKDLKHLYVMQHDFGGLTDLSSYRSLYVFPGFDDIVDFLDDNYEEHGHDQEYDADCTLCKKQDGPERCLLRAKGRLANKRSVSFGSTNIKYKTIIVRQDIKKRKSSER